MVYKSKTPEWHNKLDEKLRFLVTLNIKMVYIVKLNISIDPVVPAAEVAKSVRELGGIVNSQTDILHALDASLLSSDIEKLASDMRVLRVETISMNPIRYLNHVTAKRD